MWGVPRPEDRQRHHRSYPILGVLLKSDARIPPGAPGPAKAEGWGCRDRADWGAPGRVGDQHMRTVGLFVCAGKGSAGLRTCKRGKGLRGERAPREKLYMMPAAEASPPGLGPHLRQPPRLVPQGPSKSGP